MVFAGSLYAMQFVQQQFFPSSDRPELVVDWTLPQNASIAETKAQMDRFEAQLAGDSDIEHWSSYVGQSAVRFVLSFDVQPGSPELRPDDHRHQESGSSRTGSRQAAGHH